MKKRFISIMMALLLVAGLPVSAFADGTYYLDYGDITVTANDDGSGNTTQTVSHYAAQGDTTPTSVTDSNPTITQHENTTTTNTVTIDVTNSATADVTIKDINIENASGTAIDVNVDANAKANVTLDNVKITADTNGETTSTGVSVGTATNAETNITLDDVTVDLSKQGTTYGTAMSVAGQGGETNVELDGINSLTSTGSSTGLSTAGMEYNSTLTITDKNGDGTLNAKGGIGIGGEMGDGAIVIEGGTITATGTTSAGIDNHYSSIKISGGNVTANGGTTASGIGYAGIKASSIVISGGTVNANGGTNASGIAGGHSYAVTISGGAVTAKGNGKGAGILNGTGYSGKSSVTISGTTTTVKVQGGVYTVNGETYTAAGVGGGAYSKTGEQTGKVTYYSGKEILPITVVVKHNCNSSG